MKDGTLLLGDRWYPPNERGQPLVLIRCPYGRGSGFALVARLFAERGFQVFVQSCRGTFGSEGEFDPVRQEPQDGVDTLDWLEKQPWYGEKIFTYGLSYLGFVQWAIASTRDRRVQGMTLQFTLSNFRNEVSPHGGNSLEGTLGWATMMAKLTPTQSGLVLIMAMLRKIDPKVYMHLPLREVDRLVVGREIPWWQDWMAHCRPDDTWWNAIDFTKNISGIAAPAALVAGWYDLFLPWQVKDFEALQAAGKNASLTIGPWHHTANQGSAEAARQGLELFTALATDKAPFANRKPVRLFIVGADEWREYNSWPPPEANEQLLYLREGGSLSPAPPSSEPSSTAFVFDPADPTPSLHAPSPFGAGARRRDMTALERRDDAAVFTGSTLDHDTDIVGPVLTDLHFCADTTHSDLYACLCDVDERGMSTKVCDGYLRLWPENPPADEHGVLHAVVECGPMAYRFRKGHRIRLVITGGAHPRFARNLGTGEPLGTGMKMVPQGKQILHDAGHPSVVRLSIF